MAGDQIYIGEMLKAVNTKLDSVMAKIDSQILKLDDQITALDVVNTTVAQTITSGNIKPGIENTISMGNTEQSQAGIDLKLVGSCKVFANGMLKISAVTKLSSYSIGKTAKLSCKINQGTEIVIAEHGNTTYTSVSGDISVKAYDKIDFYISSNTAGYTCTLEANSLKFQYDIINLAVEGFVVKV